MIPIYCINRLKDTERKNSLSNQFTAQNLNSIFIEAVEGNKLSELMAVKAGYNKIKRERRYIPLSMNEIACFLSHRKVLELFLETGEKFGIVLEDDAVLTEQFLPKIEALISQVSPWDLFKLETLDDEFVGKRIGNVNFNLTVFATLKASRRTTGLLYSREGATKVLNTLQDFIFPIDNHLGFLWKNKVRILGVYPSLVTTNGEFESSISNIGDTGRGSVTSSSLLNKLFYKNISKLKNSIGKKIWCNNVAQSTKIIEN